MGFRPDLRRLERLIPDRQWIKVRRHPLAMLRRRLVRPVPLRREPEFLQRLGVQLQHDRRGGTDEAEPVRPFQVAAIGHLEVARVVRDLFAPEAVVVDVPLQLSWRSEEHTSELQSIMRTTYACFCW